VTELPLTHPSKIRQLCTKHSISILVIESTAICEYRRPARTNLEPGNLTYLAKLTAELWPADPCGELGGSGLDEIPVCVPEMVTGVT
jgi:hypothetical protein